MIVSISHKALLISFKEDKVKAKAALRAFGICAGICSGIIFLGCNDEGEVKVSQGSNTQKSQIEQAESLDKASYAGLEDVFLDTKNIFADKNKVTLLVFGKNNCVYCDKLKDDIKDNATLKNMLQSQFVPYYINTSYSKVHNLTFGDSKTSLNTAALTESYVKSPMRPTPTLVFLDFQGKKIYELPGYIPSSQLLILLEYMQSHSWENKKEEQIAREINNAFS